VLKKHFAYFVVIDKVCRLPGRDPASRNEVTDYTGNVSVGGSTPLCQFNISHTIRSGVPTPHPARGVPAPTPLDSARFFPAGRAAVAPWGRGSLLKTGYIVVFAKKLEAYHFSWRAARRTVRLFDVIVIPK
jgi:hypothetical protein